MNYQDDEFWAKTSKNYLFTPECYFIQDYICSYLNNELNTNEKRNLEQHLKTCPSCHFEYENLIDFKKELEKSISGNDIKKLFQNKNTKYQETKKFFEKFLTFSFIIILTASLSCLLLSFYKTIKTKNDFSQNEYYIQQ